MRRITNSSSAKFLPQVAPPACLAPEENFPNVDDDVCDGNVGEDGDKDGNLCCAGGVEGHVRCLDLGLAGGVRNLRMPKDNVRGSPSKKHLIGGAGVRGLPGSEEASSILLP